MALRHWLVRNTAWLCRSALAWLLDKADWRRSSLDRDVRGFTRPRRRSRCQYCANSVSATARVCPHCQAILVGGWGGRATRVQESDDDSR